jgi:hypothetical protein
MSTDCDAHATLLRHAIARFLALRIDGLVQQAAHGPHALTWALRHLVEEIRTGPRAQPWPDDEDSDTPYRTHHHRRTVMIAPDRHERAGHILRHGRTTHGRLPTRQRHHPQVHGARTGSRDPNALDDQRVRHGRRGGR